MIWAAPNTARPFFADTRARPWHIIGMANYSLAEAHEHLPELLDAAARGEPVGIVRPDRPRIKLSVELANQPHRQPAPVAGEPGSMEWVIAELERLDLPPVEASGAKLVRAMRDEIGEW